MIIFNSYIVTVNGTSPDVPFLRLYLSVEAYLMSVKQFVLCRVMLISYKQKRAYQQAETVAKAESNGIINLL